MTTPFAKGAAKVNRLVALSAEMSEEDLEDITINRGLYEQLKEKYDTATQHNEQLSRQLEAAYDEIEELKAKLESEHNYGDSFIVAIEEELPGKSALEIVQGYNRKYLETLPRSVRADVCKVLLAHFVAIGQETPDLWYSIVSKGGVL